MQLSQAYDRDWGGHMRELLQCGYFSARKRASDSYRTSLKRPGSFTVVIADDGCLEVVRRSRSGDRIVVGGKLRREDGFFRVPGSELSNRSPIDLIVELPGCQRANVMHMRF